MNLNLHSAINDLASLPKVAMRDGFGQGLLAVGQQNSQVLALSADLTESTRVHLFAEAFPGRFFQVGIAEQNMMGIAAGLALSGKIPFVCSFAVFNPGRNWEQLRVSVCYSKANVKVVGGHAGFSNGKDGGTHQSLEDLAITRVLPNMTVVCPCDAEQAKKTVAAVVAFKGPVYLRISRQELPVLTTPETPFELGKAQVFREGKDATIVACGAMVATSLEAAVQLAKEGIQVEVINVHTVKPLDTETILASGRKTGCLVTAEEHQLAGGLGSAVLEAISGEMRIPVARVGVADQFGETGNSLELFQKHGLTSDNIVKNVKKVIGLKLQG